MKRSIAFWLLAIMAFTSAAVKTSGRDKHTVTTNIFGKLQDGREVHQFTLTNNKGAKMQAKAMLLQIKIYT